jgi:enamine deaminase RidA (YjgF/YER057c/UK114 family)
MSAEQRILELGIHLPAGSAPAGNYVSAIQTGNLLFTSGRAPLPINGRPAKGKLGQEYSTKEGYELARSACIDLLAVLKQQLGSLDKIVRFIELHGALNISPEFDEHAKVMDGASDLLVEIFGPAGIHVRSVIGVNSLRNGVPLTLKATLEVATDRRLPAAE